MRVCSISYSSQWMSRELQSEAIYQLQRQTTSNRRNLVWATEALAIEVDLSVRSPTVVRVLNRLVEVHGFPHQIRVDNGPEFVGVKLAEWAEGNPVHLEFVEPGKPTQNSYVELFNRTYREEVLDSYLFSTSDEVRILTQQCISQYNGERPHKSLGRQTPLDHRAVYTRPSARKLAAQKAGRLHNEESHEEYILHIGPDDWEFLKGLVDETFAHMRS